MHFKRVAVLRGGPSEEYDISLETGARVIDVLRERDYFVKDIIISRQGEWLYDGVARLPQNILADIDVVFVALHGRYADDGEVLRVLDTLGVPYTGSGAYTSAIAFNKSLTKDHLKRHGIKMPQHLRIKHDAVSDLNQTVYSLTQMFGPQYVIKPNASNSSLGLKLVNREDLLNELLQSFVQYDEVIVEEFIAGKNATVGVLENFRDESYYTLPVVESVLPDYARVLTNDLKGSTEVIEISPGNFSTAEKDELKQVATAVHKHLGLSQYSRSDFIVNDTGIYFLEVNPRPAMTHRSSFQVALDSIGASHGDFTEQLLQGASRTS